MRRAVRLGVSACLAFVAVVVVQPLRADLTATEILHRSFAGDTAPTPADTSTAVSSDDDGNATVRFRARRTELARDPETDRFVKRYIGDVRFEMNPRVWITAMQAEYDARRHLARLAGNVAAEDSGRTMRADDATYFFREHNESRRSGPVLRLVGHVVLRDSERTLRADRIDYYVERDSAAAFGRVSATHPDGWLKADTVFAQTEARRLAAIGNVEVADTTQDALISSGWYLYSGEDSVGLVARLPRLTMGAGDTAVVVTADSMRLDQRTSRASAWDSVRIRRGGLVATCDAVTYDADAERLDLRGMPRAVHTERSDSTTTESRVSGTDISMLMDGTEVREVIVRGGARGVAQELGETGRSLGERWIAGDEIVFVLDGDRIRRVDVFGQARSHYVPNEAEREKEGMNRASGDTMSISFRRGRMERVALRGGVMGVFTPPPDSTRQGRDEER